MTTNVTNAGCWGPQGGREFGVTATDDAFTSITSDVGSAQLGEVQEGMTIDHVSVDYTAGGAAWRIRDQTSNQIQRWGLGFLSTENNTQAAAIPSYTVSKNDVLEVFTVAVPV